MNPDAPERLTGKVIGYRVWNVDGYRLLSSNARTHWEIGPNRAECRADMPLDRPLNREPHVAPDADCKCGLYSLHAPPTPHGFQFRTREGPVTYGAVAAWGRIEVHCEGIRAEWAEPVALAYHPRQAYEDVIRAESLAAEFGLPFVTLDELPAVARKHGREVPESLRPAALDPLARIDGILREAWTAQTVQQIYPPPPRSGRAFVPSRGSVFGPSHWEVTQFSTQLTSEEAAKIFGSPPSERTDPVKPEPRRKIRGVKAHLKTVGPPSHGKYREGDVINDRRGENYVCVKSGKPGTWEPV